jgi:hypothetical protein
MMGKEVNAVNKLTGLDVLAFILIIIGGLNWLLFGIFHQFDLVAAIFQGYSIVARIIYVLVGLAAIYTLVNLGKYGRK